MIATFDHETMRPFACLPAISISCIVAQVKSATTAMFPHGCNCIDIVADVIAGGDSIRKTFAEFKKYGRGVFSFIS